MQIHSHIAALGPRFRLPLEALAAIKAQHGSARMLEHAIASDDAPTQLVAVILEDTALALNGDLVLAQRSGKRARINRVRRRLDRILAAAKARALATCDA
jgi:hypothetical protein